MEIPIHFDQHQYQQSIGRLHHLCSVRSVTLPDQHDECRICLSNGGKLIQACNCRGTLRYIHEHCLQEWICKKLKQNGEEVGCELCKQQYCYRVQIQRKCSCERLKRKCGEMPMKMLGLVLAFVLVFVATVAATWLLATSEKDAELAKKFMLVDFIKVVYTLAVVSSYMLMGLGLACFINKYCIQESVQIEVQERRRNSQHYKVNKVVVKTVNNR